MRFSKGQGFWLGKKRNKETNNKIKELIIVNNEAEALKQMGDTVKMT